MCKHYTWTYIWKVNDKKQIRIAIFEDNPIMMDAYRWILNGSRGYTCIGSFNSCNNWRHDLERSNPDVVLMDIHMPLMDGYQAALEIRSLPDPVKSNVSIIALTASVSNLEQRIKDVGMNDYIYKPFNSKELYKKLKAISIN